MPELPGCASQGESLDELRLNLLDAIDAWLTVQREDGADELPAPDASLGIGPPYAVNRTTGVVRPQSSSSR